MERVEFIKIFFGKALRLEPECERVSEFAADKHYVNSIVGEQFRKYELTELKARLHGEFQPGLKFQPGQPG